VGSATDKVTEGGEELEEQGSGVGFGVRREETDDAAGGAVKGVLFQFLFVGWGRGRWIAGQLRLGWRKELCCLRQEFGQALLYLG
jgi:hypothetical protein